MPKYNRKDKLDRTISWTPLILTSVAPRYGSGKPEPGCFSYDSLRLKPGPHTFLSQIGGSILPTDSTENASKLTITPQFMWTAQLRREM